MITYQSIGAKGPEPNSSVVWPVVIDAMLNFDEYCNSNGHDSGMCKHTLNMCLMTYSKVKLRLHWAKVKAIVFQKGVGSYFRSGFWEQLITVIALALFTSYESESEVAGNSDIS